MTFADVAVELRGFESALRAVVDVMPDAGPGDQAVVDKEMNRLQGVMERRRVGGLRVRTMFNIKCQGCGVVMPEVFSNAWVEVAPGDYRSFCGECREKMGR